MFTIVLGAVCTGPVAAQAAAVETAAKKDRSVETAKAMVLPDTYLVTVTLEDFDQTLEFSTLTAQRHFSLAPPERILEFRGRLWLQSDGRELLDFSIEFHQALSTPEKRRPQSRTGRWSGSAYFELGRPIQVVESPDSKITVTLKKR